MNRFSKPTNPKSTHNGSRRKPRRHQCALCHQNLGQVSYSDHYCQTDIEIVATPYLKKLLRKDSEPRNKFPAVQHVWADPHPSQENTYLLKIKAPLDIIPEFIQEVKDELARHKSKQDRYRARNSPSPCPSPTPSERHTPSPGGRQHRRRPQNELLCSFYNSPDGCTNENCQRIHRDDPVEKARLLALKKIIGDSKVLNEPIKSHYELLNKCLEENQELNESIQRSFDRYLRMPTEKPEFEENISYIQEAYRFGMEFEELRDNLKYLARQGYTNSDPEIIKGLEELIAHTKTRVEAMRTYNFTYHSIYDKTKDIYDQQFLSRCSLVC